MKTENLDVLKKIERKSLLSGLVSILLSVGILSIIAISIGVAQMA